MSDDKLKTTDETEINELQEIDNDDLDNVTGGKGFVVDKETVISGNKFI